MHNRVAKDALAQAGWFLRPGAYLVVDGQFGSTGKGLLSSLIADYGIDTGLLTHVTSNAGPNSGHTAYVPHKVMTQQLPIATVMAVVRQCRVKTTLNAGAVIDPNILLYEHANHNVGILDLSIHPKAAVIGQVDRDAEAQGSVAAIASTGKGVGSAIARKVLRQNNVAERDERLAHLVSPPDPWDWSVSKVMVEVSQGFSLGINQRFYPYSTSRECTVQQAIADANIPARRVQKVAACYRTFPIRVGNTEQGNSGIGYWDQKETSWEELGLEPEFTSVTKRKRRVFTWSWTQFIDSLQANEPDLVFINFAQYIKCPEERGRFLNEVRNTYRIVMDKPLETLLVGFGPRIEDICLFHHNQLFGSVKESAL